MSARTLQAAKKVVRKELKSRLRKMSLEDKVHQSKVITEKLFSLEAYQNSRSVSLYLSMPSEVHTEDIMKHVLESGKTCYIPHYTADSMKMVLLRDQADFDSLPLTSWNIKQPADNDIRPDAIDQDGLDIIVVPGLGFTRSGLRLGRGRGYYDTYFRKYIEKFQKRPFLVGLAYTCQLINELPADEFDEKLDKVLYL